jgi:Mn2+/Fe2+ NRAMP family transporter
MDMNPYLSGGLCRMTKQAVLAADQLMDHNLAISDHLPAALCALLFSTLLATEMQTRIAHPAGKDIALRTLFSLWEHFILLFWTASYILLTFEHAHCLHI